MIELIKSIENPKEHNLEGYLFKNGDKKEYFQVWKNQFLINGLRLEELKKIGKIFHEHKLEVYLLKGFSLMDDIYTDIGTRFASDIDILVDAKDVKFVTQLILDQGYSEIVTKKWMGDDFKFTFEKKLQTLTVTIELHSRLFWHAQNSVECGFDSNIKGFKVLTPEEQLVHLCGHFAFQHTCLKIFWLIDIIEFIKYKKIDFVKAIKLAEGYKVITALKLCLGILKREKLYRTDLIKFSLKDILILKLVNKSFLHDPTKNFFKYITVKFLVKDSYWLSIKYNLAWLIHKI